MDRDTRIRVFLLGWRGSKRGRMGDTSVIMSIIIIKYNLKKTQKSFTQ